MEIWFGSAVIGAMLAGVSNFYFKQAAMRGYSAELFSFYGGVASVIIVSVVVIALRLPIFGHGWLMWLVFFGGLLAAGTGIMKVIVLRYIDSTIYFPLFKLVAPVAAIVLGMVFFAETFSSTEWAGMIIGLFVPLLLITKLESDRQNNLAAGLVLVGVTGILSASIAAINKLAINFQVPVLATLLFASAGVLIGTIFVIGYKKGFGNIYSFVHQNSNLGVIRGGGIRAILITFSLGFTMYAYATGGALALVQTVHSLYIIIPIVLAIIIYGEHWNLQKVLAIILSVAALALLG